MRSRGVMPAPKPRAGCNAVSRARGDVARRANREGQQTNRRAARRDEVRGPHLDGRSTGEEELTASRALAMPPIATMGIATARRTCQVIHTARGRMAGPKGRRCRSPAPGAAARHPRPSRRTCSRARPRRRPPPAALAVSRMSVTFGDSLTKRGRRVLDRHARVMRASDPASFPNSVPPASVFGQETLSSMAATPVAASSFSRTSTYSASVSPNTLATTAVSCPRRAGSFSSRNASTPTFCNPIALSMPAGVSTMRSGGLPFLGRGESPFVTIPPSCANRRNGRNSRP